MRGDREFQVPVYRRASTLSRNMRLRSDACVRFDGMVVLPRSISQQQPTLRRPQFRSSV